MGLLHSQFSEIYSGKYSSGHSCMISFYFFHLKETNWLYRQPGRSGWGGWGGRSKQGKKRPEREGQGVGKGKETGKAKPFRKKLQWFLSITKTWRKLPENEGIFLCLCLFLEIIKTLWILRNIETFSVCERVEGF